MILNPHCGGHLKNRRMNYKNKINCSIYVNVKSYKNIHILRLHIFRLFWTHSLYVSINTILNVSKNGPYLNPPARLVHFSGNCK